MKKNYIKPTIEVMEAKIEKGFAGSATNTNYENAGAIEALDSDGAIFF